MSDLIQQILDELPNRSGRSSLDPYRELILEMRRRGYSYRETARLLADRCDMKISHAAIHNFVRRHVRALIAESSPDRLQVERRGRRQQTGVASENLGDVRDRIAALKRRAAPAACVEEAGFRFDPDQPLRLDGEQS